MMKHVSLNKTDDILKLSILEKGNTNLYNKVLYDKGKLKLKIDVCT